MAVVFQRAGSSTGTSHTIDIGAAGNNRLLVCVLGDESEPGDAFQGTVTVDGKTFTQAIVAENIDGIGNHQEFHTIDEAALGSSNGSLSVSYSGGDAGWAIRVLVFYGVASDTLVDSGQDELTIGTPVSVPNIDSNDGSLVVMGAGNGSSGGTTGWTSPLTERIDGATNPPSSAVLGVAEGNETTGQTNKTYESSPGGGTLRSTAIVAVFDEFVASTTAVKDIIGTGIVPAVR